MHSPTTAAAADASAAPHEPQAGGAPTGHRRPTAPTTSRESR
ncbi:hypothetical protein ACIRPH_02340 [Nocardiopsis sp. NPDC101807]